MTAPAVGIASSVARKLPVKSPTGVECPGLAPGGPLLACCSHARPTSAERTRLLPDGLASLFRRTSQSSAELLPLERAVQRGSHSSRAVLCAPGAVSERRHLPPQLSDGPFGGLSAAAVACLASRSDVHQRVKALYMSAWTRTTWFAKFIWGSGLPRALGGL